MSVQTRAPRLVIGDYLEPDGNISIPEGSTLLSHFDRNVAELGETTA